MEDPDGNIRLLNVIPITPKERHLLREHGYETFLDYASEEGIDLFADRRDASEWYQESEAGL